MSEQVQRRLAAVLAADVVGYSRLMGIDEEGTLTRLKEVRRLTDIEIATYRGRIVKTTGDGLLAEFPSVVDAVRCAEVVQRKMVALNSEKQLGNRIEMRVGIHVGDIIFDNNDIFGDGVNIASRIEGTAEPGGVSISDDAYRQVRGKTESQFLDTGLQELKNIAEPIRIWQMTTKASASRDQIDLHPQSEPQRTTKPSIVVLPLANMSGNPEQDYFADGLTQSLTTDLSRFQRLFVIGRNTAFTFKGQAIDVREVGRTLNVRYALGGSVRRGDNRVRVNVELIDTHSGGHLWAEQFDRELADLFQVQDEIARRVAYSLLVQITKAERDRSVREGSQNPDSVDYVLRANATVGTRADEINTRIDLFRKGADLDPRNSDAWSGLAKALANLVFAGWSDAPVEDLRSAVAASQKALAINPNDPDAILAKGQVFLAQKNFSAALEAYEYAAELNPSHPNYHQLRAVSKIALGRAAEAFEPLQKAIELSPRDFYIADFYMCLGWAHLELGELNDARSLLQRSIAHNSSIEATQLLLASTMFRLGDLDEAKLIISQLVTDSPKWTVKRVAAAFPTNPKTSAEFHSDLRAAGLPEG